MATYYSGLARKVIKTSSANIKYKILSPLILNKIRLLESSRSEKIEDRPYRVPLWLRNQLE